MSRSASKVSRATRSGVIASVVVLCTALGAACGESPEEPIRGDRGTAATDAGQDPAESAPDEGAGTDPATDPAVTTDPDGPPTGLCAGRGEGTPSARCAGNVGCTELGVECGSCACTLCWNETCLAEICDDGGPGCEVPVSDCGERVFGCGSFDVPVYGGDPDVCRSGCATAQSSCAAARRCEAAAELDDVTACLAVCEGCGQTGEDCGSLCADDGACLPEILAATSCVDVDACVP